MAKMLNDVKFTAAEKRALNSARMTLDDIAHLCGSSAHQLVAETYAHETTGSHSVPSLFAVGLMAQWFVQHYETPACPRDLIGTRSYRLAMVADYARHYGKVTADDLAELRAAAKAKGDAFNRMRAG